MLIARLDGDGEDGARELTDPVSLLAIAKPRAVVVELHAILAGAREIVQLAQIQDPPVWHGRAQLARLPAGIGCEAFHELACLFGSAARQSFDSLGEILIANALAGCGYR